MQNVSYYERKDPESKPQTRFGVSLDGKDEGINSVIEAVEKLPKRVNVCGLHAGFDGPISALNLLVAVFHAVKFFGMARGINPGRPSPPSFARDLYGMDVSKYVDVD